LIRGKLEVIGGLKVVKDELSLWLMKHLFFDTQKCKDQLRSFMVLSESVKGLFKQHIIKKPKLVQLDKVLCKWFTAMHSE
jgi:hypothetical protein